MSIENIRELIKKLLALSTSPNENEAQLALEKAQELIEKYNIEINELDTDETKNLKKYVKIIFNFGKELWRYNLAHGIAKNNFCAAIKDGEKCLIIGRYINVIAVTDLIAWILPQISRLANIAISGLPPYQITMAKKSYVLGIVSGINKRLTELRNNKTGVLKALAENLNNELSEELKKMFGNTIVNLHTPITDNSTYNKGYSDADKVTIEKNMISNETRLLN